MKVHGCASCGARFPTYVGLQQHLLTHSTTCRTCNRTFTRRAALRTHKCVTAGDHLCESCRRTFSTRLKLKRHLRVTSCSQTLTPEPKRQRMSAREEDPDDLTEPPPQQYSDLQDVLTEHLSSIRSHVARGHVQTRYNFRLSSMDTRALDLRRIFQEQTTAVKVNLSYGFILKHTTSGRFKYYHSSFNCCGRYLDEPSLVTDVETFEAFLERIHEQDILQWAIAQRPNSDGICVSVTNVTFFVNKILQHPIGCVGISLPTYLKRNKAIVTLEKDNNSKPYLDNLCLFRCLGLHLGRDGNAFGKTDVPWSRQLRARSLQRRDECSVRLSTRRSETRYARKFAPAHYHPTRRRRSVRLRSETITNTGTRHARHSASGDCVEGTDMSRLVKRQVLCLQMLNRTHNAKLRKAILEYADAELISALCECAHNILRGTVRLTLQEKVRLRRYRTDLHSIANKKTAVARKRRILQQKGAFLPALLAPLASSVLLPLLRQLFA